MWHWLYSSKEIQFAEIDKYLDEYDGENAYRIAKQVFLPFDVQLMWNGMQDHKTYHNV